jgi:hypothetical protein
MRRWEHLDLAKRELAQHGIVPTVTHTNGDHVRLNWIANGQRQVVFAGESPSTQSARYHTRAQVRRLLRQAGLAGG